MWEEHEKKEKGGIHDATEEHNIRIYALKMEARLKVVTNSATAAKWPRGPLKTENERNLFWERINKRKRVVGDLGLARIWKWEKAVPRKGKNSNPPRKKTGTGGRQKGRTKKGVFL